MLVKNLLTRLVTVRSKHRDAFNRAVRSILLVPFGLALFIWLAAPSATVISPLLWAMVLLPLLTAVLLGMSFIVYCGVLMKRATA